MWGPLLGAVRRHPLPGLAGLLQRLPELRVGHRGRAGELHQDQLRQVGEAELQQLRQKEEEHASSHSLCCLLAPAHFLPELQ